MTHNRSSPEFCRYYRLDTVVDYPEARYHPSGYGQPEFAYPPPPRKALIDRLGTEAGDWLWNRFTAYYTPKHGSGLNSAEIRRMSLFSRQCLGRRRMGDEDSLRKESRAWNRRVNRDQVKIQWSFTRKKLARSLAAQLHRHGTSKSPNHG